MPTITITVTAAQQKRIAHAFGKYLNTQDTTDPANPVPRDATIDEVRASANQYVKGIVHAIERKEAEEKIALAPMDPL